MRGRFPVSLPDRVLPERARRSLSPLLWILSAAQRNSPAVCAQLLASEHPEQHINGVFHWSPFVKLLPRVVLARLIIPVLSLAQRLLFPRSHETASRGVVLSLARTDWGHRAGSSSFQRFVRTYTYVPRRFDWCSSVVSTRTHWPG